MHSCDVKNLPKIFESPAMTARKDDASGVIWNEWHPQPRPCVTLDLLKDLATFHNRIAEGVEETDWVITWSSHPTAFSLGGDLQLFRRCVQEQNWALVQEYADLCVDAIYHQVCGFGRGINTIAVVQGAALGGGFETVLSMDYLVAEPGAEFGLPELLFNLFPGMGAYSLLARKIGPQKAKGFILEGQMHHAVLMQEFGLVDLMAPTGEGLEVAARFVKRWQKQRQGLRAFTRAMHTATIEIGKPELTTIVNQWVEAVKELTPRDLRVMDLLVSAQQKLKAAPRPDRAETGGSYVPFPVMSASPFNVKKMQPADPGRMIRRGVS